MDYLAVSGQSWLHRLPAGVKLLALAGVLAVVLSIHSLPLYAGVLAVVLLLAASARLPLLTLIALTLYPLVFLAMLMISIEHLTVLSAATLAMRVLASTASIILVLLTTSYPAIFGALGRVLPAGFVAALFFTYRALFIINSIIINTRVAFHLRGGLSYRHPLASLKNLGTALAHVLVHAIETSQRMAENLTVRGFQSRVYYLGRK